LLLAQEGKSTEAEAEHRAALTIQQKLADVYPGIAEYRRGMTRSLNNLGDLLNAAGRAAEAIDYYVRSRKILEALAKDNPSVADFESGLAFSLSGLGRAHRRAGQRAEAVADLRRAVALRERLVPLTFEVRYDLARNHALLAGLADEGGSGLSPADRRVEADLAMGVLKQVVAEGYRDARMRAEPDFAPLRRRGDFQMLMLDLDFPAAPFARGD
jgi:tetratricopeptide (TPR) repeat protein